MTNHSVTIFVSANMGQNPPFVEAALICENLIIDKQDIPTVVRVIDKVEVEIPESIPGNLPPAFPVLLFLRVRSAAEPMTGIVGLSVKKPDGTTGGKMVSQSVDLGAYQGFQFKVETKVINPQEGRYFFTVLWNDAPLTVVTLEVAIKRVPAVLESQSPVPSTEQKG